LHLVGYIYIYIYIYVRTEIHGLYLVSFSAGPQKSEPPSFFQVTQLIGCCCQYAFNCKARK